MQALEARASALNRKQDARRKIILGGLVLDAARSGSWPRDLDELMIIGTIALSFAVIQFLREPKIVERLYGCTKWDQKTATCKGKWIPLHKD